MLGFGNRTALFNNHQVAVVKLIVLIVGMIFLGQANHLANIGCFTLRSTSTVTVLSILSLTTRPDRLRATLISLRSFAYRFQFILTLNGMDARNIFAQLSQLTGLVGLLSRNLHTQAELGAQQFQHFLLDFSVDLALSSLAFIISYLSFELQT